MNTINGLLAGSSPYQVLSEQSAKLAGKWDRSGLLEGIESSTERNNMSMLLENQAKQLVNEANTTGTGTSVVAGNSEAWAGVALPLVRRVFGEIVAKDLVSVQPMNLPAGLIFYLDFQYGTAQNFKAANESLYGATTDLKRTDGAFNKGLYGAGEYAYSITQSSVTVADVGAFTNNAISGAGQLTTSSATFLGILQGDTEFSASNAGTFGTETANAATLRIVSVPTASLTDFDPEAVKTFQITSGGFGITANSVKPQFTRLEDNGSGTEVQFVVSMTAAETITAGTNSIVVSYVKGPDNLDDRGDFEDSIPAAGVSGQEIPEINVQLRSDTVAAKTRKLKAQWTLK